MILSCWIWETFFCKILLLNRILQKGNRGSTIPFFNIDFASLELWLYRLCPNLYCCNDWACWNQTNTTKYVMASRISTCHVTYLLRMHSILLNSEKAKTIWIVRDEYRRFNIFVSRETYLLTMFGESIYVWIVNEHHVYKTNTVLLLCLMLGFQSTW